jgi:hypothetical protein
MDQPQGIYQAASDERRRGCRIQSLVPRYVPTESWTPLKPRTTRPRMAQLCCPSLRRRGDLVNLLHPHQSLMAQVWEAHWTFLNTDGNLVWGPDPYLTDLGESQAASVYQAWLREYQYGAPINPNEMKWYVSPMTRACQTMIGSFGRFLPGVEGRPGAAPEIWEDWREVYGSHTCDKRSTRVSPPTY